MIVDDVRKFGSRILYAVKEQRRKLRGRAEDFGGIPMVPFWGDFRHFRPVGNRLGAFGF